MRKMLFLLIAVTILLPMQASANSSCPKVADHLGLSFDAERIVEDGEPLYLQIDGEVGDQLTFEILVDGALSLIEEVELTGFAAEQADLLEGVTPVVELFAAAPARLEFLRRAAEKGLVEISLASDGVNMGNYDLSDLDVSSSLLREERVQPFDLRSSLTLATLPNEIQTKYSCEELCDLEQDSCYLDRCGQFGHSTCYQACDDDYVSCLEGCGICQPSSSSTVTESIVSTNPTSTLRCTKSFFSSARGIQRLMTRRIKKTTTTTTVNPDCSETVTTNVSYYNTTCWKWINFNGCFPTFGIENPAANC